MCTIVALRKVHPELPLILATNRDESLSRPSAPAARLLDAPRTVGGRDLLHGGTWMGVTEQGLFVGVTNQRGAAPRPGLRSRGELVLESLRLGEPDTIRSWLQGVDARAYAGFNLMVGSAERAFVAYGRESTAALRFAEVPEGVHVLPNDVLDSADFPKVQRARDLVGDATSLPWPVLRDRLQALLGDTRQPPLEAIPPSPETAALPAELLQRLAAIRVQTPSYGTRSSTVVALAPGRVHDYRVADGAALDTPFVDVLPLFA